MRVCPPRRSGKKRGGPASDVAGEAIVVTRWVASVMASLAAAAAPAPEQAGAPPNGGLLAFESGPDGMALEEFIGRASVVLDAPIFFNRDEVDRQTVHFDGKVEVPREKFVAFFEQRLEEGDFVHLERTIGAVCSHAVVHLHRERLENLALKTVVRRVGREELAAMSDRRALVIMLWYCTATPAEQIVATLEKRFDASRMEDLRHVEGTNALLTTAFASNLATLAPNLEKLGAHAAEPEFIAPPHEPAARPEEASVLLRGDRSGLPLANIIDTVSKLVDQPIFYDQKQRVFGADRVEVWRIDFVGEIRLDRSNALAWFDAILAQTRFSRQARTLASRPIQELCGESHYRTRTEARWVAPEKLNACDGEFVSTAIPLCRVPASSMFSSICCRFGARNDDALEGGLSSNLILLSGAADKLAVYSSLLHEIDRNAVLETSIRTNK